MLLVPFLHAQEAPATATSEYIINDVHFDIRGMTMERILRYKAAIKLGQSFSDRGSLDAYLAQRKQVLLNERVLASVDIEYSLVNESQNRYLVNVRVKTVDSWNIIGLPYFKYDTNDGLLFSLRGRDYNFLGSMQALVLNLDYSLDEEGQDSYGGYTSFGIPFKLLDHDAGIDASQTLDIHADERPITSLTKLGLWMRFSELGFPITFSASQGLQLNPDAILGDPDPYFFQTYAAFSAALPLDLIDPKYGSLSYRPTIYTNTYWRPDAEVRDDRKGLTLAFSHELALGRLDWISNMRRGLSASVSNTDKYNILTATATLDFDATLQFHATLDGRIGLNSRLTGFYSLLDTTRTGLGTYMRGIKSSRLKGNEAAFLSLEMPVKLFDFPTHVFIGKNWFDFELQMSPFVDLAYVGDETVLETADRLWYGGGLEFFVFPLRMRTFIVRASLGFDLDSVIRNKSFTEPSPRDGYSPYEVYFGLGLFL